MKEYVKLHPNIVGAKPDYNNTLFEEPLPSGDRVDALLKEEKQWIAVEVKPRHIDELEQRKGVYQCVKYRALLKAQQKEKSLTSPPPIKSVLVLGGKLLNKKKYKKLANSFGVEVIENISVPKKLIDKFSS